MFRGKTTARKLQLKRELMTLKQESRELVAKYVGRAKDLERELLVARVEVKRRPRYECDYRFVKGV